mmetsp:Transcript_307/g.955  ORF Transcript_307/g.955 Transcript_307/m.955 type:complete len:115 (+) Transcript_307:284-628(+)
MGYLTKMFKKTPQRSPHSESAGRSPGHCVPPMDRSSTSLEPSASHSGSSSQAAAALDPLFACCWLRSMPDIATFDVHTLILATNSFSPTHKLGEGGFGSVYRVSFLWHSRSSKA